MTADKFKLIIAIYMLCYVLLIVVLTLLARVFGVVIEPWVDNLMGFGLLVFILCVLLFVGVVVE